MHKKIWHGDKHIQGDEYVAITFLIKFSDFETLLEGAWHY